MLRTVQGQDMNSGFADQRFPNGQHRTHNIQSSGDISTGNHMQPYSPSISIGDLQKAIQTLFRPFREE